MANKLGLVFEKCKENCVEALKDNHIFLTQDESRSFSNDPTKVNHVLIEGENYHALKVLEYTHTGRVDFIYIDPPYNTGNEDFVYNDKFVDKDSEFRHSKWLSMMKPRLEIAKKLLSERGIIAISIDDNEMCYLKLLCDEVFGEENFINNIIWMYENSTMKNPSKKLASNHEYILVYCKNKDEFEINKIREDEVSEKLIKRFGKYADSNGDIRLKDVQKEVSYLSRIIPKFVKANGRQPLPDDIIDSLKGNYIRDVINVPTCRTNELENKYNIVFNNPKPVKLITTLINLFSQKDSIILDFFAGSGTTGQAVSELNKEDGGTRQFILVTNNQVSKKLPLGICHSVTYPRLQKTVSENLKYFKTEMLPLSVGTDKDKVEQLEGRLYNNIAFTYNTFDKVDGNNKYFILSNPETKFKVAVWHNSSSSDALSLLEDKKKQSSLKDECDVLLINRPHIGGGRNGYITDYCKFMKVI